MDPQRNCQVLSSKFSYIAARSAQAIVETTNFDKLLDK